MNHYFTNNESLKDDIKEIDVQLLGTSFRFYTNSGVFSKNGIDYGSKVLIETVKIDDHINSIVDMGCGYGPIGISLSKVYQKKVYMVDVNARAVELAKLNIKRNNALLCETFVSHLFDEIDFKVDMIVTNPPIRTGKQNVFELYRQSYEHLNDNGVLYVVIQKKQGAPSTLAYLEKLFAEVKVVHKQKGYWIILSKK